MDVEAFVSGPLSWFVFFTLLAVILTRIIFLSSVGKIFCIITLLYMEILMKNCDYRCVNCDTLFEFTKDKIEDSFPSNPECPECKSKNTIRKSWGNIVIPPNMKAV